LITAPIVKVDDPLAGKVHGYSREHQVFIHFELEEAAVGRWKIMWKCSGRIFDQGIETG